MWYVSLSKGQCRIMDATNALAFIRRRTGGREDRGLDTQREERGRENERERLRYAYEYHHHRQLLLASDAQQSNSDERRDFRQVRKARPRIRNDDDDGGERGLPESGILDQRWTTDTGCRTLIGRLRGFDRTAGLGGEASHSWLFVANLTHDRR